MSISSLLVKGSKFAQVHSPELLTALGISGVATTAYLSAKAAFKSADKIRSEEAGRRWDNAGAPPDEPIIPPNLNNKEKVQLCWPEFVPPVLAGTATMACIFGSHRASARRTAAAVAAYSLTNQAFMEYKDEVLDKLGPKKESEVQQEVVKEKIRQNPPPPNDQIHIAGGDSLCCDLATMRYFKSNMDKLQRAANEINRRLLLEGYMSVKEFYDEIGVWHGPAMNNLGWKSPKLMELVFTPILVEETNEPCLAFTWSYIEPL